MKRLDLFLILFLLLPATGVARAGSDNGRSETVVFVETRANALTGLPADPEGTLRSDLCDGARLVIRERDGRRRVLSRDFQSACEPDVSFDAKHILFAGRKRADQPYNIFEIGVDGHDLRQITRDAGNCRQPRYLSTYYVITANEPWLQILFVSDAAGEINEKGNRPATDLYSCRIDGSEVRRVTYNPSADQDPFLMWDGRILFAGWQAALPRHGGRGRMRIFDMNVDGTDLAAFTGEQGRRVQQMPTVTTASNDGQQQHDAALYDHLVQSIVAGETALNAGIDGLNQIDHVLAQLSADQTPLVTEHIHDTNPIGLVGLPDFMQTFYSEFHLAA